MVIFASVGPVISTRRSTSPGAGSATRQSPSRMSSRLGQEPERAAGGELRLALLAGLEQLQPPGVERPVQVCQETLSFFSEDLGESVVNRSGNLDALNSAHVMTLSAAVPPGACRGACDMGSSGEQNSGPPVSGPSSRGVFQL